MVTGFIFTPFPRECSTAHAYLTYLILDAGEELGVGDGVTEVGLDDVEAKTFGRLVGHLDSVLQDGHGEGGGRVAGQPDPEIRVRRLGVELLL